MKILAIETSCDETAMCILECTETPNGVRFLVQANVTNSQIELHRPFGGVFPALAKREHQKNLPIVLEQVLQGNKPDFDYICVTSGPGLEPALWTGILFARELGEQWNVPVVPVNHMEGHVLSVLVPQVDPSDLATLGHLHSLHSDRIPKQAEFVPLVRGGFAPFEVNPDTIEFPAIALLISGGHTELVLVNGIGDYEIIGKTVDDAVGEAFDKVARILGLPYPGGPEISKLSEQWRESPPNIGGVPEGRGGINFPRPMIHSPNLNFSFSGLKTAVLYYSQTLPQPLSDENKIAIANEFQNAVADVLVHKTKKSIETYGAQTLIIGGGVSANTFIKSQLQKMLDKNFPDTKFFTPTHELSTDNAMMIALAGYFKIKKSPDAVYTDIRADGNWSL